MSDSHANHVISSGGVALSAQEDGEGPPIVLLHGLTATRRYVVMGSRSLERSGHRVITYDARGHGHSSPAPDARSYGYERLTADLEALLDDLGIERATLAGASMGAHTAVRLALERPERVAALGLITPAFDPSVVENTAALARWDALASALRRDGIDGFVAAYAARGLPDAYRDTLLTVIRQRLGEHDNLGAVANALNFVPRSRPFESLRELREITVPTVVIADRDSADPEHPLKVGEAYAREIPGATLVVEDRGRSPIAWQGGQLSRVLAELAARAQQ
jgi:pimeloyl-ACP methyl ester carboxylesterase